MQGNIISGLMNYEHDFPLFQKEVPRLRLTEPNKFVAFKDGKMVAANSSIDEVKKELNLQGIEPSGAVIEFVSEKELKVIV